MILHIEEFGNNEGYPIVFLHSGLQTGLTDFESQREFLLPKFRVILPDLRGHGNSNSNNTDNYFEQCANDLYETLQKKSITKFHLVGASIGGLVALKYSHKFSSTLLSLTVSGVIPVKPENWQELQALQIASQRALLQNSQATSYFDHLHKCNDWRMMMSVSESDDWYPFQEKTDIENLNVPFLFIVGDKHNHELDAIQTFRAWLPESRIGVIPNAGHLVQKDQPSIYNQMLESFIQSL